MLYDLLVYKIDKICLMRKQLINFNSTYNANHSEQYYSTVWTKRISKLIVEEVIRHYLVCGITTERPY